MVEGGVLMFKADIYIYIYIYIYMTLLLLLVRMVTETLLLLLVRLVIETLLGLSFATAANEDGGEFAGIDGC